MSGDTAVPLPEPADQSVPDDGSFLTADQRRRVEALQVSRQILENKAGLFAGSKVEANRAVYDLTYLADWIIDGPDSYASEDDTVDLVNGHGERVASISTRPGQWADVDQGATADLQAARSDADDGV
jgi:hypothetical protein